MFTIPHKYTFQGKSEKGHEKGGFCKASALAVLAVIGGGSRGRGIRRGRGVGDQLAGAADADQVLGVVGAVHAVNGDGLAVAHRGVDEAALADVHAGVVYFGVVAGEVHPVAGDPARPVVLGDIVADLRLVARVARQGDPVGGVDGP